MAKCGRKSRWGPWLGLALTAALVFASPMADAETGSENHAVVVMYHRFGENVAPSTNIKMEQFEAHIAELTSGKYTVWPLTRIVEAVKSGTPIPDRTVAITVDDAYRSVYEKAWPLLREAGLPWTLFVATRPIDRKLGSYMTWDQIRELRDAGVTIGSQTATHLHMVSASEARNREDLETSNRRFQEELGERPALIAYPYGEAGVAEMALARELGFVAGFGQHSGVLSPADDLYYLPRFAMNENYGDMDRFRLAANAKPIPVRDVIPADPVIGADNPPNVGFTVAAPLKGLSQLACFASHEGKVKTERIGEVRIEVRFTQPFPKGRTRLNCTMPAGDGRWRWTGRQFYRPGADD